MKKQHYSKFLYLIIVPLIILIFGLQVPVSAQSLEFDYLGSLVDSETCNDSSFGMPIKLADVNGDGYKDILISAYSFDKPGQSSRGRLYVFLGGEELDKNSDYEIDGEDDVNFLPPRGANGDFALPKDIDKDGYNDIIVAPSLNDDLGTQAGKG